MQISLDISQIATLIASIFVSVASVVVGIKVSRYYKLQDKKTEQIERNAERRERRQTYHFKKVDAMFFAVIMTLNNVDSEKFKTLFTQRMKEMTEEDGFMEK